MGRNKNRENKTNDDVGDAPRKKHGSPSDFAGQRLQFLTAKIPEYIAASKKKKGSLAKTEGLKPFWATLFNAYWKRFPWDLPLDQDPAPEVPSLNEDADTTAAPNQDTEEQDTEEVDSEESDWKEKVMKDIKDKIKRWFLRQRPGAMGIHGNPYFEHLAQLRREESAAAPPKHPADFQWYMRHADFKEGVNECFQEEYGDEPKAKHLALRCEVASAMFKEEPEEADLESYNESGAGMPDVDPNIQRECRENFLAIVQPLLAGLQEYTGLTLNIIGARMNEDTHEFETMSANTGVVDGKDWPQWDPQGYAATLKNYLKFVHARHLESQSLKDAGPSTVASNASSAPSDIPVAPSAPSNEHDAPPNAPPTTAPSNPQNQPSDLLESSNLVRFEGDGDVNMGPPPIVEDVEDEMLEKGAHLLVAPSPVVTAAAPAASALVVTPALPATPSATAPPPVPTSNPPAPPGGTAPAAPAPVLAPAPSAPVDPAPTWGLEILNDDLRAEILAKGGQERENYIRELRRMNEYWLQRENNMARNRRILREMDLNQVTSLLGMKRPGKKSGGKPKKKAKAGEEDWSNDNDSDNDNDSEGEEEDEPATGEGGVRRGQVSGERAVNAAGGGDGRTVEAAGGAVVDAGGTVEIREFDEVARNNASAEGSGGVGQEHTERDAGHRIDFGDGAAVVGVVESY
ncbi:hypothetical protein B0H14DRAFT_3515533 [Mycena olivaceomarginata]|nr:hypothetical protein B0H14DRAFT_3515533 [Mycena olivaceomarginata]